MPPFAGEVAGTGDTTQGGAISGRKDPKGPLKVSKGKYVVAVKAICRAVTLWRSFRLQG